MINLELPKKLKASANQAHQVAAQIFRPVSRKYDLADRDQGVASLRYDPQGKAYAQMLLDIELDVPADVLATVS